MKSLFIRVIRRLRKLLDLEERHRFYLVSSPSLPDRFFAGPHGHQLYASAFNPEWFRELGVTPKVIVDVGSFDGGDALRLQEAFKNCLVVTIEADPTRAQIVREALKGTKIIVEECAVIDNNREVSLYRTYIENEVSSQGSIYKFDKKSKSHLNYITQDDSPMSVQGKSLDSIFDNFQINEISLLHMDIQGAEYDALLGLGRFRPNLIYLEVNAHYDGIKKAHEVNKLLDRLGYRLAGDFISDRLYVHTSCLINSAP